jgi:hypothetical protein
VWSKYYFRLKEPLKNEENQICPITRDGSSSRLALNFPGTIPGNQSDLFNKSYFSEVP